MPRFYTPKGKKLYRRHDPEKIKKVLEDIASRKIAYRDAEKLYGIPRSVLSRHKQGNVKKQGGQTVLSDQEEELLIRNINICADWGYPIDSYDLRLIVKNYLDKLGKKVPRFKNNIPGSDFVSSFLKRHKSQISKRMCENIKRARARVSRDVIEEYFSNLSIALEGVPSSNIINYDETNLSDDIGRKKIISRRGCKHPERIINTTKSATSIMFAVSGDGHVLPTYVVYKAQNLYSSWTEGGPRNTRYNRTSSGWFDMDCFEDWAKTIVIPYVRKLEGRKILIGDNLASHISLDLVKELKAYNVDMIFLPANSTHLTQPLDVAFFRPVKIAWRNILEKWKKGEGRCEASVPKTIFPRLLHKLMETILENSQKNIISGFRKTGILPLNKEEVLKLLPKEQLDQVETDALNTTIIDLLKEMRYSEKAKKRRQNKKLTVEPGKSVQCDSSSESSLSTHENEMIENYINEENDLIDEEFDDSYKKRDNENNIPSDDDSDDLPLATRLVKKTTDIAQTTDCINSLPFSHSVNMRATKKVFTVETDHNFPTCSSHSCDNNEINCDFNKGDWVLVQFPVERKTATIKNRVYIGKIISILENSYVGSFLRKKDSEKGKLGPIYYYPAKPDEAEFARNQIIRKILFYKEKRGLFIFQNIDTKDYE